MSAFELKIPDADRAWAIAEARRIGAKLLDDGDGGHVLVHDRLPPTWARWAQTLARSEPRVQLPQRHFALSVPFAERARAQALGARWDTPRKCWFYKGDELPGELAPYKAPPMSWESAQEQAANGDAASGWKALGVNKIIPRDHQTVAARAAVAAFEAGSPGFLISDEVGLGKTISAWLAAQEVARLIGARSMLIVSPLSVLPHWRDCAMRMDNRVEQALALNYDRLDKLFQMPEGAKAKSKKGVARKATAPQIDLVIFDESHKLKNPTTARFKLAQKIASEARFCLYLSATAGQNPLELAYLGAVIAKATGVRASSMRDFEQWCQDQGFGLKKGKFGGWEWVGDQRDCERLRHMLFEGKVPAGIRRRPEEIKGWPAVSRSLMGQELDSHERELYQASWGEFKNALSGVSKAPAGKSKRDARAGALVEALRFRQKSSLLRIDQTVAFALDLFEDGLKPAISCAFKASVEKICLGLTRGGLRVARIDGSMSSTDRENARLDFQFNRADAMVFTIEEGISLHEGEKIQPDKRRALLVHDLRWSAIQMAQIEGRAHRDGKFAQAYWLAGEGTIEMSIAERVERRAVAMKTLSGDEDASLDEEIMKAIEESVQPWKKK